MLTNDLIDGLLKGKQGHFTILYENYSSQLYSICLRYSKDADEAKDLLQEGFVKIFQHLKSFDSSRGNFEVWMKRIFVNLCIDNYRKKKTDFASTPIEIVAEEMHDEDEIIDTVNDLSYNELIEVISKLPNGYRTVFNMFIIDEKSHKEIADLLNISESTSKTQLLKARNLLKKIIIKKVNAGSI